MKISVIGLGFVGTITGGVFCELGHDVIGFDSDSAKVELFAGGRAPVAEPGLDQLMTRASRTRRLSGAPDVETAVARSDLTFICVRATSHPDDAQDTLAIEDVARRIGKAIARKQTHHSVVVRSTVLPGTTRARILPALEHAVGGQVGRGFGLAHNPEFTREGSAISDFRQPPRIVIGELDAGTSDKLASLYSNFASPLFRTGVEVAEAIKYADNSWHALKVAFANEIGSICDSVSVDRSDLMTIFCADDVLNISPAYLGPGFAFGGPCLPVDIGALVHWGKTRGLELPVLSHISDSNERLIERTIDRILRTGHNRVGLLGLSYKAGVGDLRGSPYARIANRLIAAGRSVRAFDPGLSRGRMIGASQPYMDDIVPTLDTMLVEDLDELLAWAQTIILTSNASEYAAALEDLRADQVVLDLIAIRSSKKPEHGDRPRTTHADRSTLQNRSV